MNEWWKKEVAYQIYPRSFKDSNHDGIGDIKGITSKLDYLSDLGVTLLWLCPIYKSPMDDNGYDISDYYDINPEFGTMDDLDELIAEAKKRHIKIIMDLVINHSSDEHEWFKKAIQDPGSKEHDYYIFKQGVHRPNNWRSVFGGSVWEKVPDRDEWYMHSFSKKQPDLNWENKELRQELYKMINWWLNKGIAGFRVDAINFIKKDQRYLDGQVDGKDGLSSCFDYCRNQPGIEVFFDELKRETFAKHNCMTVAEAVGVDYKDLGIFIGKDGCFSMMFDFNYSNFDIDEDEQWFNRQQWDIESFKKLLFTSQEEVQKIGWIASFLENHDQPRAISKFFPDPKDHDYYTNTLLAGMFFNLRGTPFIYQGEEIGMENFKRSSIDEFDDISSISQFNRAMEEGYSKEEALYFVNLRSRDNTRTPMQWDDSVFGGFSSHVPWIKMAGNQDLINAASQVHDPRSIYAFYKRMIEIRKQEEVLVEGSFKALDTPQGVIGYKRVYNNVEMICLCNFNNTDVSYELEEGAILLSNYEENAPHHLKPHQFMMIKRCL